VIQSAVVWYIIVMDETLMDLRERLRETNFKLEGVLLRL
jgi:hypothetical protein